MEIKFVCNKCGRTQKPDKKESNENWNVYPNEPCECKGEYKPKIKDIN